MPALRSRANKCIRDGREWGRYAGVVIEGKMHEGVQHKIVGFCTAFCVFFDLGVLELRVEEKIVCNCTVKQSLLVARSA
jgi:hypothetical protein